MVDHMTDVDGFSGRNRWVPEQDQALGVLNRTEVITGAEVRRTSSEQRVSRERVVAAARSKLDVIDCASTDTPGGGCMHRVGEVEQVASAIVTLSESAALFHVADQDQRQAARNRPKGDIFQPQVKGVLKEAANVWRYEIVVQTAQPGKGKFSDTDINIINARAITGRIQPEIIVGIRIKPVVEPLTTPE